MNIVEKLGQVQTGHSDVPVEAVIIEKVVIS